MLKHIACAAALGLAACSPAADETPDAAATTSNTDRTIPSPADTDLDKTTATYSGPIPMPIRIGGDPQMDGCGTASQVANLDPQGDNFLSVRDAPSTQTKERDRLDAGQMVSVCATENGWSGVVYSKDGDAETDCGVGTPIATEVNYTGPCRSGWVDSAYLEMQAG